MFILAANEIAMMAVHGFQCMQKIREFEALLRLVAEGKPERMMEIGVGKGGSSWAWSKIPSLKQLIAVDLPNGPWGGGPDADSIQFIKTHSVCPYEFIPGNSQDPQIINKVKAELGDHKLDFLFIDGDHSYEGVKKDYEVYSELVADGGLIAFHDVCVHPSESGCEVADLWNELKKDTTKIKFEFIEEPKIWGGIAVIIK